MSWSRTTGKHFLTKNYAEVSLPKKTETNMQPIEMIHHAELLQKPRRRSSRVAFEETDEVLYVKHISEFSQQEIQDIWFSVEDFAQFKEDCKRTISMMKELGVSFQNTEVTCSRGLEHFIETRKSNRKSRRANASRAVLAEQELQFKEGSYDPEYIAEVYQEISVTCQAEAYSAGLRDQEEAYGRRNSHSMKSWTGETSRRQITLPLGNRWASVSRTA